MKKDTYQMIVGLEVHVQLQTESKLFCGCRTTFGSSPNTQTCPICTGMPGTLPVLNRKALELSIKTGEKLSLLHGVSPPEGWSIALRVGKSLGLLASVLSLLWLLELLTLHVCS